MSADRIGYCPECCPNEDGNNSLREYYNVYIKRKILFIEYECKCHTCGFEFEYKYRKRVDHANKSLEM